MHKYKIQKWLHLGWFLLVFWRSGWREVWQCFASGTQQVWESTCPFSKKVHLRGSCLCDVNIVEIWLFDATSRNRDNFVFKYKLQIWEREGGRENEYVRLSRLCPATSEQLVPGAECHAMSSTKPHQFILAYKCKAPLMPNLGPISCPCSRIFMVDSGLLRSQ